MLVNEALGIPANICLNDGRDDWRLQQCYYYDDISVLVILMTSGGAGIFFGSWGSWGIARALLLLRWPPPLCLFATVPPPPPMWRSVLVTVLLGNVSPLLLELLMVNRLASPKRRTGHVSCCPVNRLTARHWRGGVAEQFASMHAITTVSGFLPPVGMCSATSPPVTATDLVTRT